MKLEDASRTYSGNTYIQSGSRSRAVIQVRINCTLEAVVKPNQRLQNEYVLFSEA